MPEIEQVTTQLWPRLLADRILTDSKTLSDEVLRLERKAGILHQIIATFSIEVNRQQIAECKHGKELLGIMDMWIAKVKALG